MMAVSTDGSAWSKFNAASTTTKAAARQRRRRLRSGSSSSDEDDAGLARQLLRESRQAAAWASTKTEAAGPATTVKTTIRIQRRLLTWAELGMLCLVVRRYRFLNKKNIVLTSSPSPLATVCSHSLRALFDALSPCSPVYLISNGS
jgi:hypothetical protein